MTNQQRIDQFLKEWVQIAKDNPHLSFEGQMVDSIYHSLIMLGVDEKDKPFSLDRGKETINEEGIRVAQDSVFNTWKKHFRENDKIDVFVSPEWKYFCQFISKNQAAHNSPEHIKVYIPLDVNHIEEGAIQIFQFLTNANIPHLSKIGKKIRFDDIVIRLVKEEDASRLIDFVKHNPYLQEGLIKANPFAFQKDGIALACDGDESYNMTIASLVQMYIGERKRQQQLDMVSYGDFYRFIATCYKKEFVTQEDNQLERVFQYEWDEERKDNYKHIFSLILQSQNPEYQYPDYIAHFHHSLKSKLQVLSTQPLLMECIDTMTKRFQSRRQALLNIEGYIDSGKPDLITRTNDLRTRVTRSMLRYEVRRYLKENGLSFMEFINQINPTNDNTITQNTY